MSRRAKMQQWINYRMRITIQDGREIIGQFMAYDKHMNLVIGDAEEYRRIPKKGNTEEQVRKRILGFILLRGEEIVSLSVEGPPPPEVTRSRILPTSGPGIGKSSGRGISAPPPSNVPPPGLGGNVSGLGGPSQSSMEPSGGMPPPFVPGFPPPGGFGGFPPGGPPPFGGFPPGGFPGGFPPNAPPPGTFPPA